MNSIIKRTWNQNRMVEIEDLTGSAFQSESGGHTFEISGVDDSGASVSLSGTVEGRFLRPDNALVTITGTASGGKVSVTLTSTCYAVNGRFSLTIFVTSGGQKTAVYSCVGIISVASGTAGGSVPPLVTDSIQTVSMTASGNVTVGGVLDVTQRRCEATIPATSGSGQWYRVFDYSALNEARVSGDVAFSIDITILEWSRQYHKITLYGILSSLGFGSENSVANISFIDKIRYWKDGTHGYIDVHFTGSVQRNLYCHFDVKCNYVDNLYRFAAVTPTAVVDSPSGTLLADYTFSANTITDISSSFTLNTSGIAGLTGKIHAVYDASSGLVHLNFAAYTASTTFGTSTAMFTCSDDKYKPKANAFGNGMIRTSGGEWYPYEVGIGTSGDIVQSLSGTTTRVYGQITYSVN